MTLTEAHALGHRVAGVQLNGIETAFATRREGPSPWSERWLQFADGRAVVTLHESGDPHIPPPAIEREMLERLLRRSDALPSP